MNQEQLEDQRMGGMRNVWILTISMAALAICYTMLVPFLPVYLLDIGVPEDHAALWSGAVFSITFFIAGIMAPIWGKIADKKGKKMMAVRAGFAIAFSYFLLGLVQGPWQLMAARAFQGFANGFMPAAMTMVSLSVNEKRVGAALGIFQTGLILGNVVGPFMGGVIENFVGMRPAFSVAAVIVGLATAAVLFFVKEPQLAEAKRERSDQSGELTQDCKENSSSVGGTSSATTPMRGHRAPHAKATAHQVHGESKHTHSSSIWEDFKFVRKHGILVQLLWIYFFMQCALMMLQPILALYVGQMQGTMQGAAMLSGTILSMGGIAGSITTNLWVRYGQKKGYFRVISLCLTGAGTVLLLQSLPFGVLWFGALQILVGSFLVGVNPSLSAAITLNTDPDFRGRIFGMTSTAQQFGCMVGPLFASVVSTYIGMSYVFVLTGLLLFYLAYTSFKLSKTHSTVGQE
ncbi:MAG: MFS transporter [Veillonella sp.]|nr:MFS transporter [Veillonella sp.]